MFEVCGLLAAGLKGSGLWVFRFLKPALVLALRPALF